MKEVIAITNQKGGVGKSTTANSMGAFLYRQGERVLYIDLDSQCNLSLSMDALNREYASMDILLGRVSTASAICKTNQGDIISGSPSLASADVNITGVGMEYRLREAISPVKDDYDYIIIDCPPSLNILTINALTSCTSVLIPTQADIFGLQGIGQLAQAVKDVKRYCNNEISIKGILLTRCKHTNLTRGITESFNEMAEAIGCKLYESHIRECNKLMECQTQRQDIFSYAPKSNAARDYIAFCGEYLKER